MKGAHYQFDDQPQYGQPQYGQPQYGQPVDAYGRPPSYTPDVTPLKPEAPPASACRDLPWAVLFLINLAVIAVLTVMYGKDAIDSTKSTDTTSTNSDSVISAKDTKNVLILTGVLAVIALCLAQLSVALIVKHARTMIMVSLWFSFASSVAMVILGFYLKNYVLGVIGIVVALLTLCYVFAVRSRIPFAVANLNVAAAAVSKHWSTYLVSLLFTIVQIVWVVVWSLAFLGVFSQLKTSTTDTTGLADGDRCYVNSDCQSNSCARASDGNKYCYSSASTVYKSSSASYAAYFFLLLSFYWGLQVFKNVSHTTVAGAVATFWYNSESAGATGASLKRATTTSFGSICFGSLLVAIIQALRELAIQAQEQGDWLACIANCILSCLQSLVEYINRWAYIYVGIYGYKFTQAGRAVFDLFHQRGFDAIINDDLIGNMLNLVAFGVGIICALIGVAIAQWTTFVSFDNATVVLGVLGLFIGAGVAITPLSVIDSAVATIFVCFAEDPVAFQRSHPDLYQPLVTEWHNMYPEMIASAGYWTPVMC